MICKVLKSPWKYYIKDLCYIYIWHIPETKLLIYLKTYYNIVSKKFNTYVCSKNSYFVLRSVIWWYGELLIEFDIQFLMPLMPIIQTQYNRGHCHYHHIGLMDYLLTQAHKGLGTLIQVRLFVMFKPQGTLKFSIEMMVAVMW